jgi:uncharacterized protein YbcI
LGRLSTGMVKLMRETVGRGPTHAKSHMAGPDVALVLMSGGLLPAEKTLQGAGRVDEVNRIRAALQEVLEERMTGLVRETLGREVIAFMSAVHQNPDMMAEVFVLAPQAEDPPG